MSEALRRPIRRNPRMGHAVGRTARCFKRRTYGLVLLCHKLALWQQGHLGSRRAIVRANLMRMLVMDDLTWRSVRIGGSAGSKTVG